MRAKFTNLIATAVAGGSFTKLVCSKPTVPGVLRTVVTLFTGRDGGVYAQAETFQNDGKALHKNLPVAELPHYVETAFFGSFLQMNLFTTGGEAGFLTSKKGKETVVSHIRQNGGIADVKRHDNAKSTILKAGEYYPFLHRLGVSDAAGGVFDKKRAKFRQINQFLAEIETVYEHLPATGTLTVLDLCCGKSYLTFATYWYLTAQKGRTVAFYGVDRKADVVAECSEIAKDLGYTNLQFLNGDINAYTPPAKPDLVVSLHACDIATDIVLAGAVRWGAAVILSAPCCHHEMMGQMGAPNGLQFAARHSMLKQKLCDAFTDGLRALRVEAEGYHVTVREFIDPEETPKNLLLRCIRTEKNAAHRAKCLAEYQDACAYLGVTPYLSKLLGE